MTDDQPAVYEAVLESVDSNTGGEQRPLASETAIIVNVSRLGDDDRHPNDVRSAIEQAIADSDLFRGETPDTETPFLGVNDTDALESKIESYAEQTNRVTQTSAYLLKLAREQISELEGSTDE